MNQTTYLNVHKIMYNSPISKFIHFTIQDARRRDEQKMRTRIVDVSITISIMYG